MEFGVYRVIGIEREASAIADATATDNYTVLFVSAGGCRIQIDKKMVEVDEYSLVLVPRGVKIAFDPNERRAFLIIYFSENFFARTDIDASFIRSFKSFDRRQYTYQVLNVPQEYATYYEFVGLQLKLSKQNYNQAIYRDLAHNIVKQVVLLAAIYMEEKGPGELLGYNMDLVRRFQDLVGKNVKKEKRVMYYAGVLNIGSKKLTSLTNEVLGITPKDVITGELLRVSKKSLAESSLSIKQIAWELGYTNVNNFSTFFLKETGVTPKEFRKRWQG